MLVPVIRRSSSSPNHASHLALLIFVLTSLVCAQEPSFRSRTSVVLVPALVKDRDGKALYGLQAHDFIIEDDGVPQELRLDETVEAEPVSIVIAIQRGRRAFREFDRMGGLGAMLDPILGQGQAQVALVEFDSNVEVVSYFTHDQARVAADLKALSPGDGGAAILDAIDTSVKLLDQTPQGRRRMMLLISETRDHGSHASKLQDVVTSLGSSNTVVYALAFSPSFSQVLDTERGSNRDEWRGSPDLLAPLLMASQSIRRNTPKAVTEMTGGEYELFKSHHGFESRMIDFTNHLHSRYLLSFEPNKPRPGLHVIRVRLREPGKGTVLARTSYWAIGNE
jgi:VWFA-related protein